MKADLNQLRIFVKVVESGSFTKAAAALHQPKSRVSRWIASLEKDLNMQLIYRTTRQLQLTESGRIFYEKCRPLVSQLESITENMEDQAHEVVGPIRVTAPADMAQVLLPEVLTEFKKIYPRVHFQVQLSQEVVDLVKDSIDVAFRISPLKDSSLRMRKVSDVRSILVAPPQLMARYADLNHPEQLKEMPLLDFVVRKNEIWRLSDGQGKIDLKIKADYAANNPLLIKELVLRGKGVALLPEFICLEELRKGQLIHILKNWQGEKATFSLVMPGHKEPTVRIKKFVEFAARMLKQSF